MRIQSTHAPGDRPGFALPLQRGLPATLPVPAARGPSCCNTPAAVLQERIAIVSADLRQTRSLYKVAVEEKDSLVHSLQIAGHLEVCL